MTDDVLTVFSCQHCYAWHATAVPHNGGLINCCILLRSEGLCGKQLLALAIEHGVLIDCSRGGSRQRPEQLTDWWPRPV